MSHSNLHHPRFRLTAIAAVLTTTFALPLAAQTAQPAKPPVTAPAAPAAEQTGLETVVITAQRRAEPLQSAPLSVTALTGEQIKNANITTPERLEQVVPGLRMGRSGSDLRPAMRGTYTENVSANSDPRFGIYVDDVYQSRTSQVPPMVDLARAEVQKGPQGTLYGRNSFGGNLVFYSALPTDELEGGLDFSFGNYLRQRTEGFVNLPISEGIAFRFAGLTERTRGYVKNIGTGNDIGGESQKFFRGTLRIAPPTNRALEVILRASNTNLGGEGQGGFGYKILGTLVDPSLIRTPGQSLTQNGVTYTFPNGFNGRSFTGMPLAVDPRYRDGIADINGADVGIPVSTNPYEVNYAGNIFRKGSQQQYSANVSYDAGPVRFRSISSFSDFNLTRTGSGLTPVLLDYAYAQTAAKTYSQEFQVLSNDENPGQAKWIAGAYFYNDTATDRSVTNRDRSYVAANQPLGSQYYNRNGAITYLPTGLGLNYQTASPYDGFGFFEQKTRSNAIYGQLSQTFLDKLTLTGGLRYTQDKKSVITNRFTNAVFPSGAGAYLAHDINDPIDRVCGGFVAANPSSRSTTSTGVAQAYDLVCANNSTNYTNFRLAADYKFNENQMVYASFSNGTHAGGFNSTSVLVGGVPTLLPFAPEKVRAFEIGSKNTLLDKKLTLNAAAFLNNYTDLHAQTSVPIAGLAGGVAGLTQNSGRDRAFGIELEAAFRPIRELRLSAGFNYLNAKQLEYATSVQDSFLCFNASGCVPGSGEQNTLVGSTFPNLRTDPNRFVPVRDDNGNHVVSSTGQKQYKYVIAGTGLDGTKYTAQRAFSPKVTIQLGAAYTFNLGDSGTLTPEIQTYYNSGYILTDITPGFGNNPAFTKTDLRLTYVSANGDFRIQAFVNNIENKATISRASYIDAQALLVAYAPPRSYGIKASYRF